MWCDNRFWEHFTAKICRRNVCKNAILFSLGTHCLSVCVQTPTFLQLVVALPFLGIFSFLVCSSRRRSWERVVPQTYGGSFCLSRVGMRCAIRLLTLFDNALFVLITSIDWIETGKVESDLIVMSIRPTHISLSIIWRRIDPSSRAWFANLDLQIRALPLNIPRSYSVQSPDASSSLATVFQWLWVFFLTIILQSIANCALYLTRWVHPVLLLCALRVFFGSGELNAHYAYTTSRVPISCPGPINPSLGSSSVVIFHSSHDWSSHGGWAPPCVEANNFPVFFDSHWLDSFWNHRRCHRPPVTFLLLNSTLASPAHVSSIQSFVFLCLVKKALFKPSRTKTSNLKPSNPTSNLKPLNLEPQTLNLKP